MKEVHDLVQGTPEWHAHRSAHLNASDAPAMMGVSPYKTRAQLLQEKHTGLTPDVDAGTQRRFDDGHRFEALARPIAEEIIGEELYPVTISNGELSASFDGLSMDESTAFEHKTLNDELRAIFGEGQPLPLQYRVQMEQQCMVSGATRVLFMATKWEFETLIEEVRRWYIPDMDLREAIIAGWRQFAADLAAHVPTEVIAEVVGRTPQNLPALRIEVTGKVTASNLAQYREHALAVFAGINRDLKTDQDFANADKTVKWCGEVESRLAAAKQHALSQTESIDKLFATIDDITAEARATRLELNKLVEARKIARKGEIVAGGVKALGDHVAALNARLGKAYMPAVQVDFGGAVKGLRTFDSMQNAIDTALANAKIAASATADRIAANVSYLDEDAPRGYPFLFADVQALVLKPADDFRAIVDGRIAAHKAKREQEDAAQRERIRTEELQRIEREQMAAVPTSPPIEDILSGKAGPVILSRAFLPKEPEAATPPTLTLGQIGTRLGFNLSAEFIRTLGFEPAARARGAVLYHEESFGPICEALVSHVQSIQALQAA